VLTQDIGIAAKKAVVHWCSYNTIRLMIGRIQEFDPITETVGAYIEHLSILNSVLAEKVLMLLTLLGTMNYSLL